MQALLVRETTNPCRCGNRELPLIRLPLSANPLERNNITIKRYPSGHPAPAGHTVTAGLLARGSGRSPRPSRSTQWPNAASARRSQLRGQPRQRFPRGQPFPCSLFIPKLCRSVGGTVAATIGPRRKWRQACWSADGPRHIACSKGDPDFSAKDHRIGGFAAAARPENELRVRSHVEPGRELRRIGDFRIFSISYLRRSGSVFRSRSRPPPGRRRASETVLDKPCRRRERMARC